MSKIVSIAASTCRIGVAGKDDVVLVYGDDVELGPAYDTFRVIDVPGLSRDELTKLLSKGDPLKRKSKYSICLPLSPEQITILSKVPLDKVKKKELILSAVIHND